MNQKEFDEFSGLKVSISNFNSSIYKGIWKKEQESSEKI